MNLYLFIVVFIWHILTSNKITFRFMSCSAFKSRWKPAIFHLLLKVLNLLHFVYF